MPNVNSRQAEAAAKVTAFTESRKNFDEEVAGPEEIFAVVTEGFDKEVV